MLLLWKARGIVPVILVTGEIERHSAHAVVIASGGYGNVWFLIYKMQWVMLPLVGKFIKRGLFCSLVIHKFHPTCIPFRLSV
jgi:succinate dehydrogenase / fumarate reductase flavoprotein subunit